MCLRGQPWARGRLHRGLRPCRLFFLYFRLMMPDSATHSCAGQAMATRYVTDHAPDDGAFNTTMGVGNDRWRRSRNRYGNYQ